MRTASDTPKRLNYVDEFLTGLPLFRGDSYTSRDAHGERMAMQHNFVK